MPISLDQLLSQADELIEKNASQKPELDDEDIFKLAEKLKEEEKPMVDTPFEKVARAIAVLEAVQVLNHLESLDKLEKMAKENGFTEEEILGYMNDNNLVPLHKAFNIPESLLC